MGKKWSETDKEGQVYSRVLTRLLRKLDRMTKIKDGAEQDYDIEKVLDLMQKAGYCLQIKVNVGLKTDWEKRIKYLEGINTSKQKHEEMMIR